MSSLKFFIRATLVSFLTIGGSFFVYYFIHTHLPVSLAYKREGVASANEWSLSFGREVRVMRAALNPPVSGKWYVKNDLFGSSVLKFAPSNGFVKGETYVADIAIARTYDEEKIIEIPPIQFSVTPAPGADLLAINRESGSRTTTETPADLHAFAFPGYVVVSFSTSSPERGVRDPIEISFDQPVDQKSAEEAFRISPAARGSFSWEDKKLIFTPAKFVHQKKYTISMNAGIKAKYGLPSREKVSATFTTVPEVYKLKVSYFKQAYSRSCEAASLRMALAYYGVATDDMEIIQKAGYNPRPKDKEKNEWDDPHEMFVGDASKDNGEGYGMYREPLVKSAQAFGRTAYHTTDITPQFLAKNVRAGYPVVVWGYTSSAGPKISWNTPNGEEALAIADEHARLVVGVYGSVSDPVGFYLHDPLTGEQYEYWDTDDLMKHISVVPGVTNQAVVVK